MVTDSSSSRGEGNKVLAPFSYTEVFEEQLPFYLSIGMTWDDYWNGDVTMVKYYRKAFQLECERKNQELWLMGAYVYDAICRTSPILHAFAKRGTKPVPYTETPYKRSPDKEEAKSDREKEKLQMEANLAKVMAWMKLSNKEVE